MALDLPEPGRSQGQSGGYPGPPPRGGLNGPRNRNLVVGLFVVFFVTGAVLLITIVRIASGVPGAFNPFPQVIFFMMVPLMIFSALLGRLFLRRPRPAASYDTTRYNLFRSSLEALSLGVGAEAPALLVMETGFPDSWVDSRTGARVIAVSPVLLSMDLTDQEIEAIVATGLARMIDRRALPSWPDIYEELDVDADIIGQIQDFTWDSRKAAYCTWALRADALAARLTGQPGALQSAITKVKAALNRVPQRFGYGSQLWFVDPLILGPLTRSSNKVREELTRLRLESLERIEAGKRPDFSELRDGRPVVGPKGWE